MPAAAAIERLSRRICHYVAKIDSARFTARKYHSYVGIGSALGAPEVGGKDESGRSGTVALELSMVKIDVEYSPT